MCKLRKRSERRESVVFDGQEKRHRNFIAGPMDDKDVEKLPGIATEYGQRMSDRGFDKVRVFLFDSSKTRLLMQEYKLFGMLLVPGKDETRFRGWL